MPYEATLEYVNRPRSGIALGGIGTGGVELRHDGIFTCWHIFNNLPFASGARFPFADESMLFFIVRYQVPGKPPRMKLLQIDQGIDAGGIELFHYTFPWMRGIERITSRASFPFTTLTFTASDMPFDVVLEAFSPFIPHDVKNSALPGFYCNFHILPHNDQPVDVMLMATQRNAVGYDVQQKQYVNRLHQHGTAVIAEATVSGLSAEHATTGSQLLASLDPGTTHYLGWEARHGFYEWALRHDRLPNLDDTAGRNTLNPETEQVTARERSYNTLAVSHTLHGKAIEQTFIVGWYFPNLYSEVRGEDAAKREGNFYANHFGSALEVVAYLADKAHALTARTRDFHAAFFDSTIPEPILDQINSHLNTLITSTWLTQDGKFALQEGLTATGYWGPMSTIDVAVYGSVPVLALFPSLDKAMLRTHCAVQLESGEISHGIDRNFDHFEHETRPNVPSRVDLSAQYTILVLRHALWTGDLAFLREMWESVQKALDYVVRERDANGDCLPDIDGVNSSYDNLSMHGAAAFTSSLWLSALTHTIECADLLEDRKAAARYAQLLEQARLQHDRKLWTGRYYRLYNDRDGKTGLIDEGCLTDQLIGDWCNRLTGVQPLIEPDRIRSILETIYHYSFEADLGIRNCSWPGDAYLHDVPSDCWWDQANTVWTGSNFAFASHLLYEGRVEQAESVILTIDRFYRRNGLYFDHQEWGGHYFRSLSAWAVLHGYLGLSIKNGAVSFAPSPSAASIKLFFAHSHGTGFYAHDRVTGQVSITTLTGVWTCRSISLNHWRGELAAATIGGSSIATTTSKHTSDGHTLHFDPALTLQAGEKLLLTFQ
ncbi:MAG: GH116 family glycosyl hydrolase [bacterium]|nr:GH116 family glycosyl hydrolase [bacterium]